MTPAQSIEVQLWSCDGQPLRIGNVLLEIDFFTSGNYRYGFTMGRTDAEGQVSVSYNDIEQLRSSNACENLMDYNTSLEACDPRIRIVVPSDRRLREKCDTALRFYSQVPEWAKVWPSNGQVKAVQVEVELVRDVTSIHVQAE